MLAVPSAGLSPVQAAPSYDTSVMSAVPVSALYVPAPTATTTNGRKVAVTVLSILLGLFVLISATLGVLYVRQGQESARQAEEIAALQATEADLRRNLDATERSLRRADEDLADVRAERDALAACLTAIFNLFDAAAAADGEEETPQIEQARSEVSRACREVQRYL